MLSCSGPAGAPDGGSDIHLSMPLEQMFPCFYACICRECAACLSRELAICVTKLVHSIAKETVLCFILEALFLFL